MQYLYWPSIFLAGNHHAPRQDHKNKFVEFPSSDDLQSEQQHPIFDSVYIGPALLKWSTMPFTQHPVGCTLDGNNEKARRKRRNSHNSSQAQEQAKEPTSPVPNISQNKSMRSNTSGDYNYLMLKCKVSRRHQNVMPETRSPEWSSPRSSSKSVERISKGGSAKCQRRIKHYNEDNMIHLLSQVSQRKRKPCGKEPNSRYKQLPQCSVKSSRTLSNQSALQSKKSVDIIKQAYIAKVKCKSSECETKTAKKHYHESSIYTKSTKNSITTTSIDNGDSCSNTNNWELNVKKVPLEVFSIRGRSRNEEGSSSSSAQIKTSCIKQLESQLNLLMFASDYIHEDYLSSPDPSIGSPPRKPKTGELVWMN